MPSGNRIKEARMKRGLTQAELGKRCGIADSNIRKYESGKQNPKLETLQRIADALEVPLSEIYSDARDSEPPFLFDVQIEHPALTLTHNAPVMSQYLNRILTYYGKLNDEGQKKLLEHAELLLKVPEYQKEQS